MDGLIQALLTNASISDKSFWRRGPAAISQSCAWYRTGGLVGQQPIQDFRIRTGLGRDLPRITRRWNFHHANDITLSPPIERHTRLKGETLPQGFRDYGLSFDGYGAGHGKSFQLWLTNFKAKKS